MVGQTIRVHSGTQGPDIPPVGSSGVVPEGPLLGIWQDTRGRTCSDVGPQWARPRAEPVIGTLIPLGSPQSVGCSIGD